MSNSLEIAAEDLRQKITAKVEEIKNHPAMAEILENLDALHGLQKVLKLAPTPLSSFLAFEDTTIDVSSPSVSGSANVRFDEFFAMDQLDAAKAYLRKTREARPFDEIVEKIAAGGGKVLSVTGLQKSLSRSTLDVVKIGDRYGLREHYPAAKLTMKTRKVAGVADSTNGQAALDTNDDADNGATDKDDVADLV